MTTCWIFLSTSGSASLRTHGATCWSLPISSIGGFAIRRCASSEPRDVTADEDGNLTIQRMDEVNILSDSGADLNQWRVGFEWSWVNELTVIPIRVGAKNLPQVSAHERRFVDPEDGEITTSFDNQVVGTAVTAGVGFVTDAFVFDLSMEYGGWRQELFRFDSEGTNFQESKTRRLALKTSLVIYF